MNEFETRVAEWLNDLTTSGAVVHEVAAVLTENTAYAAANRRYRALLADVAEKIGTLYEQSGHEPLLDCERDIRRLIQWADSGSEPVQLELWAGLPEVEA